MIPNTNLESCRMQELLIQYFNKRWVRLHILLTLPFECYRCPASVAMWGNLCASTVPGYSCSSKSSKLTPSATRRRGKLPPLFIQEFRNFSLLLHSKIKKTNTNKKIIQKVKKQVGKRSYAAIFIYAQRTAALFATRPKGESGLWWRNVNWNHHTHPRVERGESQPTTTTLHTLVVGGKGDNKLRSEHVHKTPSRYSKLSLD